MIYTVTLNPALDRELVVSKLKINRVLRSIDHRIDFGGKGINVSRGLATLGEKSVVLGFTGGKTGDMLEDGLEKLELTQKFIRVHGETRTNISIASQDRTEIIKVNEPGPHIPSRKQDELLQMIHDLARPDDWWVLSGSLPPGVTTTIYASIVEDVQCAGAKVLLDTSGEALREGCRAQPFLVKSNELEASQLTQKKILSTDDVRATVKEIHVFGIEVVVITLGSKGAIISDGVNTWMAEPPAINEMNPAGAGDAFVAGLIYGLSRNESLPESLTFGVACGSASASLPGTSMAELTFIEKIVPHVFVKRLN
jgi:1-phosphofructokinase family hexose kinase